MIQKLEGTAGYMVKSASCCSHLDPLLETPMPCAFLVFFPRYSVYMPADVCVYTLKCFYAHSVTFHVHCTPHHLPLLFLGTHCIEFLFVLPSYTASPCQAVL